MDPVNNTFTHLGFLFQGIQAILYEPHKEYVSDREGVGWPQVIFVTCSHLL